MAPLGAGLGWTQLADKRGTPFDWLERREQMDIVEACLREIDERLRAAVVLRDIEGHSYNEIAETLQISLGTVKSRVHKALLALNTAWHREHPQEQSFNSAC